MAQPSVTDSQVYLAQQAAAGSPDAFDDIFHRYYQTVHDYCMWLTRDPSLAADITQEAFIKAYNSMDQLGPPWNVRGWLYRIARNAYIDATRSRRDVDELEPDRLQTPPDASPERIVSRSERDEQVRRAIWRLPEQYREVMVLREFAGLSYQEIADTVGVSLSNVRVLLHRGRKLFKEYYGIQLLAEDAQPDCDELGELLDAFYDDLSPDDSDYQRIKEHVDECPTCQQRNRELTAMMVLFSSIAPFIPPPDLERQIQDQTTGDTSSPSTSGRSQTMQMIIGVVGLLGLVLVLIFAGAFDDLLVSDPDGFGGGGEDDPTQTPVCGLTATCGDGVCEGPCEDSVTCFSDCVSPIEGPPPGGTAVDDTTTGDTVCAENGGLQWQGVACVCAGVVDEVTICNDGTKFDNLTDQPCTPDPEECAANNDDDGNVQPPCVCGNNICQAQCGENPNNCAVDCP